MNNLANHPEFHSKTQELNMAISDWMTEQGDDGNLIGERIKYSDMPFSNAENN